MKTKYKTEIVPIDSIKLNDTNPRNIVDEKFLQLVESIEQFPQMLHARPIVVDEKGIILGGNMRYQACKELSMKEVPVIVMKGLTKAQKDEFVIKDNASFGEWDWEVLENDWNALDLENWGIDLNFDIVFDDGELDGDELNQQANQYRDNVRKAIMIDFDVKDYEEAYALCKELREQKVYVGKLLMKIMKDEKDRIDKSKS